MPLLLRVRVARGSGEYRVEQWVRCRCKCGRSLRISVQSTTGGREKSPTPGQLNAVRLAFDDPARDFGVRIEKAGQEPAPPPVPPPTAMLAFGASVVAAGEPGSGERGR